MFQQIFLGDCSIQLGKKFGISHNGLQPAQTAQAV
jgi:hypothetical protein